MKPVKFLIYYRDMPVVLENFVNSKGVSYVKDGLRPLDGSSVPRITVTVHSPNEPEFKDKLKKLERMLEDLKKSGQIVDYK